MKRLANKNKKSNPENNIKKLFIVCSLLGCSLFLLLAIIQSSQEPQTSIRAKAQMQGSAPQCAAVGGNCESADDCLNPDKPRVNSGPMDCAMGTVCCTDKPLLTNVPEATSFPDAPTDMPSTTAPTDVPAESSPTVVPTFDSINVPTTEPPMDTPTAIESNPTDSNPTESPTQTPLENPPAQNPPSLPQNPIPSLNDQFGLLFFIILLLELILGV